TSFSIMGFVFPGVGDKFDSSNSSSVLLSLFLSICSGGFVFTLFCAHATNVKKNTSTIRIHLQIVFIFLHPLYDDLVLTIMYNLFVSLQLMNCNNFVTS